MARREGKKGALVQVFTAWSVRIDGGFIFRYQVEFLRRGAAKKKSRGLMNDGGKPEKESYRIEYYGDREGQRLHIRRQNWGGKKSMEYTKGIKHA